MIRVVHAMRLKWLGENCSTSWAWGEPQWPGILVEARTSCTALLLVAELLGAHAHTGRCCSPAMYYWVGPPWLEIHSTGTRATKHAQTPKCRPMHYKHPPAAHTIVGEPRSRMERTSLWFLLATQELPAPTCTCIP